MQYIGSLFFGVNDWCEICNNGNELYHIVVNKFGDELHICSDCLEVYVDE